MALIESIIQINKAYKCAFFVNESAVKAKASEAPPQTPLGEIQRSPNPLDDVIGCNSCGVLFSL